MPSIALYLPDSLNVSICCRYNEALKIKTDSWEATASLGQLEWERAKARLGYIVPSPRLVARYTQLTHPELFVPDLV
jgi:hypothetical protein